MAYLRKMKVSVVMYDHSLHKIDLIQVLTKARPFGPTVRVDSAQIEADARSRLALHKADYDKDRYSMSGALVIVGDDIVWAELVETKEAITL